MGTNSSGLEDIKQAIEQLTLRSYGSSSNSGAGGRHYTSSNSGTGTSSVTGAKDNGHQSSYSTSTYSSMSGSECDRHRRSHLIRHSSLETINTQVSG